MSDLWKIVLTSALTVVGGVTVFAAGQLVQRFFIEPIYEQAKVIGEIVYSLIFYANVYARTFSVIDVIEGSLILEVMNAFRKNASQLIATTDAVRIYWLSDLLKLTPPRKNCMEAARLLIGLSNSLSPSDYEGNMERRQKISNLLRIKLH